ncbi:hypothetical protein L1887_50259 [Cichorium endivia]|nr:hypothetical protein L1887_50259 [Cichorium endivia]
MVARSFVGGGCGEGGCGTGAADAFGRGRLDHVVLAFGRVRLASIAGLFAVALGLAQTAHDACACHAEALKAIVGCVGRRHGGQGKWLRGDDRVGGRFGSMRCRVPCWTHWKGSDREGRLEPGDVASDGADEEELSRSCPRSAAHPPNSSQDVHQLHRVRLDAFHHTAAPSDKARFICSINTKPKGISTMADMYATLRSGPRTAALAQLVRASD